MRTRTVCSVAMLLGAVACAEDANEIADPAEASEVIEHRGAPADDVIQPGAGVIPMAITEDDYLLYQQGQTLFVTGLGRGAPEAIAEVPAGNFAFVYTSGKVAFIWTNPDLTSPSFGVSPLVIWSARYGARAASDDSPVGTLTTVASRDGRQVVFPTHASNGGIVGDVVLASADLHDVTPLVSGIQTDYSNGPCRPLSVFVGAGHHAYPALAYCPGSDVNATLTVFRPGARRDLTGLVNPPRLSVDPDGEKLLTVRASEINPGRGTPLLVTEHDVTSLGDVLTGSALFTADGAATFSAGNPPGNIALRRARFQHGRIVTDEVVPSLVALLGVGFGSNALSHPLSSRDGRWLAYGTAFDPATGLVDVNVVDLHAAAPEQSTIALDPALDNASGAAEEPFTQDSAFVLSSKPNFAAGTAQLFATSIRTRERRAIGDATGFSLLAAAGSFVAFNDHVQFDPSSFFLNTADLRVADAADRVPPRLLATAANSTFFLDHSRTRVIYATDEAGRAGLHVARIR